MKKTIHLLLLASIAFTATLVAPSETKAQSGYLLSSAGHASTDTLTNAGTVSQLKQITGYHKVIAIQTTVTKVTGTPAGTVVLYGSLDGVTYDTIPGTERFTITNVATQTVIWPLNVSNYAYYKVVTAGSGTQSSRVKSYYIIRD